MKYSHWLKARTAGMSQEKREGYCLGSADAWQEQQKRIDELEITVEKQKNLSIKAIDNAKAGSSLELQLAQKLHAESQPDLIESERAMNAQLTNENLLLESKVSELQARVDTATNVYEKYRNGCCDIYDVFDEVEQALKGGEA